MSAVDDNIPTPDEALVGDSGGPDCWSAADPDEARAYDILRGRARRLLVGEAPGHTLQATALVHEAYLRLADADATQWQSRAHFLAVASRVMRRILIDHARTRARHKRGGGWNRVTISLADAGLVAADAHDPVEMIQFDRALAALEREHARLGRVAEMVIFGGMNTVEIAASLGLGRRTIDGDWAFARRWLAAALQGPERGRHGHE